MHIQINDVSLDAYNNNVNNLKDVKKVENKIFSHFSMFTKRLTYSERL